MITILSLAACILTMVNSWLLSRGQLRAVYIIGIISGTVYTVINGVIACSADPGVAFLAIPSMWGIAMCISGLKRISPKEKAHESVA